MKLKTFIEKYMTLDDDDEYYLESVYAIDYFKIIIGQTMIYTDINDNIRYTISKNNKIIMQSIIDIKPLDALLSITENGSLYINQPNISHGNIVDTNIQNIDYIKFICKDKIVFVEDNLSIKENIMKIINKKFKK